MCDPLLDKTLPERIYLRNNDPLPLFNSQSHFPLGHTEQRQISTRSSLEHVLLKRQSPSDNDTKTLLIQTIITTAFDFHAAAISELSLQRYRLDSNYFKQPKETYKYIVRTLNLGGGWVIFHDRIHKSLNQIKHIGIPSLPEGEIRRSLELEIESLEMAHTKVKREQMQIVEYLQQVHEISFTESVERLTTIAFLFLPFSTIATILSIDDTMRFGIFFALALPVLLICIAFGIHGASLADLTIGSNHVRKRFCLVWTSNLRKLFIMKRPKENIIEPDVESVSEETGKSITNLKSLHPYLLRVRTSKLVPRGVGCKSFT